MSEVTRPADPAAGLRLTDWFTEIGATVLALRAAELTVAVAESCTGGLLGAALTALPGSSEHMRGGVIAYADDVKAEQLGVSTHLLATHGAVSERVARAMADGARVRFGSGLGLGITGVAGPSGGTEEKPAGLVFVAATWRGGGEVVRLEGDHGREVNRARAVVEGLRLIRRVAPRIQV